MHNRALSNHFINTFHILSIGMNKELLYIYDTEEDANIFTNYSRSILHEEVMIWPIN
jgi:hypothetical protein